MTDIFINSAKACAFTGHRKLLEDFSEKKVKNTVNALIKEGFDTFLVGMAVGFDMKCFKILEKIREKKNIKIIACIPCKEQNYNYNEAQNEEYLRMLNSANESVVLSEKYSPYCMMKRNKFMVDNSCLLISYLRQERGGTFNTVKYAEKTGKKIIFV